MFKKKKILLKFINLLLQYNNIIWLLENFNIFFKGKNKCWMKFQTSQPTNKNHYSADATLTKLKIPEVKLLKFKS